MPPYAEGKPVRGTVIRSCDHGHVITVFTDGYAVIDIVDSYVVTDVVSSYVARLQGFKPLHRYRGPLKSASSGLLSLWASIRGYALYPGLSS